MFLPWCLCGILTAAVIALCVKLYLMKKSVDEIGVELEEHLCTDTNTLIAVSSGDRHIRLLAARLNQQLRILRQQRQRYLSGDQDLKEAVTNISHDLRTPLTAICGYLELLKQLEIFGDAARYLGYIEDRTQALKQLTEELFRYSVVLSDVKEMSCEKLEINRILEESIAAFYAALKKRNITPVINMPEQKIFRNLNHAALSRIFSNILNNALKYSDGDLEVALLDSGEIIFTNTAAGLDEILVGRLFDRFFSVEAARNSTGLGLAISKALVEQMKGTITARYQEGRLSIRIVFADA